MIVKYKIKYVFSSVGSHVDFYKKLASILSHGIHNSRWLVNGRVTMKKDQPLFCNGIYPP